VGGTLRGGGDLLGAVRPNNRKPTPIVVMQLFHRLRSPGAMGSRNRIPLGEKKIKIWSPVNNLNGDGLCQSRKSFTTGRLEGKEMNCSWNRRWFSISPGDN